MHWGTHYVLDVNDDVRNALDQLHLRGPRALCTFKWLSKEGTHAFVWTRQPSDVTPPRPGEAPMPPKGAPSPRGMVHGGAGAPTARPQSGAGAWPCGRSIARGYAAREEGRASRDTPTARGGGFGRPRAGNKGADTMAAPEHPPRVCEVLNSFDGKTDWGCQIVSYHVLQRYDFVVDARDVADEYGWAYVRSQGFTGWAPRAYLKNFPLVPAKVSLALDCSCCAPFVNVVRLPLPQLKSTAPLAVCVCDSQSDIMSKSQQFFIHFSGKHRIAEQYAHFVTSNDVMHCQFASFGGPSTQQWSW